MAASCPFCSHSVSEELARHGGNCPHCFNPIPGEEAATDPGVEAQKAEAEAAAVEHGRKKSGRLLVLSALLLAVVVGGGWTVYQQQQKDAEIADILMDDGEVEFFQLAEEDMVVATEQVEAGAENACKAKSPGSSARPPARQDAGSFNSGGGRFAENACGSTSNSGSSEDGPKLETTSMGIAGRLGEGPSVGVTRADVVLTDAGEIQAMAGAAMRRYSGQIKSCYEGELKGNEGLRGAWTLTFTINPDGSTSGVAVQAHNGSDAGLEGCMKRQVSQWKFQKIARAQPVGKKYRFGSR